MAFNYVQNVIRRSRLIMPANQIKFAEKAYLRNADAIVLDLEDSVPLSEKLATRAMIKGLIPVVAKGGSDVFIRVNHTEDLLIGDIEAAVWPGVTGILFPKAETGEQVRAIDDLLTGLEETRGLPNGQLKIGILIETVKGYLNAKEIVQASERIDSVTLGAEDFSLDSGIEQSEATYHGLVQPRIQLMFVARAYGKLPLGLMGSLANFSDSSGYEKNALLAYKHGFLGASCIHPDNVEILNTSFSPTLEQIDHSKRVIDTLESVLAEGRASAKLDGKMIDYVHYEKAKQILERNAKIKEFELRKKIAREAVIGG